MSGKTATLQPGIRLADYLSTGLLARLCPPDKVAIALAACGRQSQRQRDLPAHATAYYVMALSLYQGVNYSEVLRIDTVSIRGSTSTSSRALLLTDGCSCLQRLTVSIPCPWAGRDP